MVKLLDYLFSSVGKVMNKLGYGMRAKLIMIFLLVKVIPLILLTSIAWRQFIIQGDVLKNIAVFDSAKALNDSAVENIERMSTSVADRVAEFLYQRDDDIRYLANLDISEKSFGWFIDNRQRRMVKKGQWVLKNDDKSSAWVQVDVPEAYENGVSTNIENDDMNGFHPRPAQSVQYQNIHLYDEITYIDLEGNELIKSHPSNSTKIFYPLSHEKKNVSKKENTYVKAENYFNEIKDLKPGEIYVSDVIGAYVKSNYIGMYTPDAVAKASADRGYEIEYHPENQAYAGMENPNGKRFEGIIRWATPVTDKDGKKIGYVTMALNHDHIMEFVDHLTPMNERFTQLPSAFEGNYAFIWDYKGRSISHPRHHSIVGFDPDNGEYAVPWLETSIYEGWQASGIASWADYTKDYPIFFEQSRTKKPAASLTKAGMVGLDCRYLNNAPQCTGWMDLTEKGGSGSFYILWSGLYKLNTAAAIPYYTGHYAPSEANAFSRRGFGFVAIGSGLEFFTLPAKATEQRLEIAVSENLKKTFIQLVTTTVILVVLVVMIAIWMASYLSNHITGLIDGISRYRAGERQFRFNALVKDEFATLADSFDDMANSLAESIKNPLAILDMDRKIIYVNDQSLDLFHRELSKIVGMDYADISIYPTGTKYCPINALEQGNEAEIYYLDDIKRYVRGKANYLMGKEGKKIGYIVETVDVTEMVIKQLELEEAMNAANIANEHKGEFLAHMSHEIRTPMNAIIGLSAIVQKNLEEVDCASEELKEIKDHVKQIESSSHHLLGLLNDILDLSKIEAGKIELSEEVVELVVLIDTVNSIIKGRCKEKNITYNHEVDAFTSTTFLSDPLHLRQVLINLLGNAVKFTPENGTIEFLVRKKEQKKDLVLIEFVVKDSGIGISEEGQATIFKPFEQANGKITRQYGGTGLGLTISRHIVQLFGGDIGVKSEVGKGSEFNFSIWLKETKSDLDKTEALADPTGKFVGKKVLLVDDVDLNRKIARAMLKVSGISIDEAEDGSVALKKFEESPIHTYDIILMDVQMPIMDGYQASSAIRNLSREDAANVPIIALTANAFKEDIDKALKAGMNAHIAKPVRLDKIIETLFKYIPLK